MTDEPGLLLSHKLLRMTYFQRSARAYPAFLFMKVLGLFDYIYRFSNFPKVIAWCVNKLNRNRTIFGPITNICTPQIYRRFGKCSRSTGSPTARQQICCQRYSNLHIPSHSRNDARPYRLSVNTV